MPVYISDIHECRWLCSILGRMPAEQVGIKTKERYKHTFVYTSE